MLHVITRMIIGGAQENTLLTAAGIGQIPGYEVHLVSGVDTGTEGEMSASVPGISRFIVIPEMRRSVNPVADAIALWKLYRFMRREQFDIVHTHLAKAGILGRLAARMAGVPVVVHGLHGMVFNDYQSWIVNRAYWAAQRLVDPLTDHYVTVSTVVTDKAVDAGIGTPDNHTTVYSGMELDWFTASEIGPVEARLRWGIPASAKVVGTIARMVPVKGYDILFDTIPAILGRHPDSYFLLVGDGPLRDELLDRAARMGVAERVVFCGLVSREDIPGALAAMDLMAHPARYEGLPRVLVQALAMEKPCVAFDADGTREVVVSGETGYLIAPGDSAAFADAVNTLLSDPERRRAFGKAGRKRVDPAFRVETMVSETNRVYKELLQRRAT
ncbi:MAG: glycosyltransferase family 4 protein [Chloroflexota bacterium]|nr:glycosyltransferase family 4 protein [Chloroflexota bacterium]